MKDATLRLDNKGNLVAGWVCKCCQRRCKYLYLATDNAEVQQQLYKQHEHSSIAVSHKHDITAGEGKHMFALPSYDYLSC